MESRTSVKVLKFRKLTYLVTSPFVIVGFLSFLLIASIALSSLRLVIEQMARDVTTVAAAKNSQRIEAFQSQASQVLKILESNGPKSLSKASQDNLLGYLHGLLKSHGELQGIYLYANGNQLWASIRQIGDAELSELYPHPQGLGMGVGDRESVLLLETGSLSEFRDHPEVYQVSKLPWRSYPSQLKSRTISVAGKSVVVSVETSWAWVADILWTEAAESGLDSFLVDSEGKVLVSSMYRQGLYTPSEPKALISGYSFPDCRIRCVMQEFNDQFGLLSQVSKPLSHTVIGENGPLFANLTPIATAGSQEPYYLFSVLREEAYLEHVWSALSQAMMGSTVVILVMFATGLMVSYWISRPIKKLNESAQRIGKGDWEHDIAIDRDDEIGDLGRSLNQMAFRLRELVKDLEGLVEERTSDLKNVIEKYAQANKELERTNATKDRFFSIIAHDLKSPFMALKGYSGIIEDSFDSLGQDQLREMVNKISVSSEEAHGLLENLLQWAIIQSGGIRVKWEAFDLREVVLEVFDLMKVNAKVKSVKLVSNIKEPVWVEADRNMISTVLRNIVSNSIKFTTSDHGRVEIELLSRDKNVEVLVRDNGIGIKEENIRKLFDREIYFTEKGTSNERGTGLGLGLCKEFVMMNRGNISVESQVGQGTSFRIQLLAAKKGLQKDAIAKDDQPISVLCVDDSEDNHNLIKIFLKNQNWELSFASDGREALKILQDKVFDVILMDLNMPVMGGIETTINLRTIEREQERPRAHVIAFTSSVLQDDIDNAIQAGCDSYLVKPIKKQKLINAISRFVSR
ncbi:hybrid sensor histidine kinase/response regulator [Pseudobacteriovorax antillogorgiicola]|uniref:histidine kinase n=1 Tax=Pseudobacteriovorax antillogorgiicola TaxID=1513793 RepID=A0A1Y6BZN1_9BACT|nr:hybrid sensor histidine kinase/response regulator [Pseudobacteriovorax antillogorgiicola]TCS51158.1 signal transduction histidine kinase [Pseudobacteriovorax antillogorgiicola]SMF38150.1 Signal transduction histidine kinase [Pseudobacteriovorax antillogorgiicola]